MTWNLGFCPDNTTTFEILLTLWGFFCTNLLTLTSHETFNRCPTYTEFIVSCLNLDLMHNGANKNEGAAISAENVYLPSAEVVTEYNSKEIGHAGRLFTLLWGCILFDLCCFHTFFKVSFLCSLFFHCFNCTNGKIWEPSGGQNNICKSHSVLTTSAWSSNKSNSVGIALLICLITFFLHFCPCTFIHILHVLTSVTHNSLNLSRQLKQHDFYCG